jgi:tetratricopeptide (TPR) repeat protein
MNKTISALGVMVGLAAGLSAAEPAQRFEWTTSSAEAKKLLIEVQTRIENFQAGGAQTVELARKLVAADPKFAMGTYYLSVVVPGDEALELYEKSRELAKDPKSASDGERRFIEGVLYARINQGRDFAKCIEPLEAISKDYPGERLVWMVLGQLYSGDGKGDKARDAFEHAQAAGPRSARADAFLAGDEILKGNYEKARAIYQDVQQRLPKDAVPFAIRFGITWSHLYEGHVDAALDSLQTYLKEYRAGGLDQQFPEVFIWNAMARINLENGRLEEAMKCYEQGYKSVPESKITENEKKTWLGRLHHGTARTLAKMGQYDKAWAEAETVKKMIEDGGEEAKTFWPAYHYVAGYVKLEAGDTAAALEHLKQADPDDPFHNLLLGRAYEKAGNKDEAKKAYAKVVASQAPGLERALAYPEAKKKLQAS